ncbi:probable inorganic phosphate transporter 1-9 [Gastrolobium bilobum]|uniref:probable inorganic phosphate transporter 1-9 n=1 Tax=Gastrolobium bilobum TaxID=150636 RepID=UPI002AB19F83|nr:probable inorganic phosphate transporter 1-9 [Gastrolobium bilobum]
MAKLKLLSALDTARTQYYHFKAIIIAGMGLFTDAYDLFSITLIVRMIGRTYYGDRHGDNQYKTPPVVVAALIAVALLGMVIGQLVFGRLGDLKGRRYVYGLALLLMIMSSLASGFSVCIRRPCVLLSLGLFRFFLGLGIGGDYPLSSTIMSEFANKRTRGSFIAAVFSMQGFGILASATVTMVVCSIFRREEDADFAWRLILMIGSVPAGLTYYWRMKMPETARYTALVEQDVTQAVKDMERVLEFSMSQISGENTLPPAHPYPLLSREFFRRHGRDLFACSSNWFLLDIVFYSNVLFQSQIYKHFLELDDNHQVNVYHEVFHVAKIQAIIAVCSTIPGYFFSVYFIDRVGRVKIQMMGFFFMALIFWAIGIPYYSYWTTEKNKNNKGFIVLYSLAFFFANFGPNTTTFIVPAELFPARFRSTCHGISGAFGKVGAIIGTVGFLWASHKDEEDGYPKAIGMEVSLVILGVVCIVGMLVTYFFTMETMGRSLEENEIEPCEHEEFKWSTPNFVKDLIYMEPSQHTNFLSQKIAEPPLSQHTNFVELHIVQTPVDRRSSAVDYHCPLEIFGDPPTVVLVSAVHSFGLSLVVACFFYLVIINSPIFSVSGSPTSPKSDPPIVTNYILAPLNVDNLDGSNYDSWTLDLQLWLDGHNYTANLNTQAGFIVAGERT